MCQICRRLVVSLRSLLLKTLVVGKSAIRICFQKLFKVNVQTNFNSCSSRGGKKSDSDFPVPA